jgi:hypothetical protein
MGDEKRRLDGDVERGAAEQDLDPADLEEDAARETAADLAAADEMRAIEDEQREIADDRALAARVARKLGSMLERGRPPIH